MDNVHSVGKTYINARKVNNIHRRRLAVNKASIGSKMVKIQGELQPRTMNF